MSPDDLIVVDRSWGELRHHRDALVDRLTAAFNAVDPPDLAEARARWLVDSISELVGLLAAPSELGAHARRLAATWPQRVPVPSWRVDGRAWMSAARDLSPTWTTRCDRAWRRAWLLLSDVLAEESPSPFAR